ncbi:MAG TPA: DUF4129 domain-containing protein, partial [Streptosporangiaceae bacterium]|nr:DUF4129 domain-containing protein [Streptosporangiaceae bacterium]
HPHGRRPHGPGALTARLAMAAAALAVTAAGLRAALPSASWSDGPWHQHGIALGAGLEVVFAGLLVAVEVRRRRDRGAGQPAAGLRAGLRAFLVTALIAIPVLVLVNAAGQIPDRPAPPQGQQPGPLPRATLSARPHVGVVTGGRLDYTLVWYALLILAILVTAAIGVILVRRRARPADWADVEEADEDEPEAALRRAVTSGQAALHEVDDARLAIIACYVAMEGSLARAGTVRGAAETPDELLGRAAAAGLAGAGAAATLTALFYEARFSSHPLPATARVQARDALAELATALAARAAREAATVAGPGTSGPGTGGTGTGGGVTR